MARAAGDDRRRWRLAARQHRVRRTAPIGFNDRRRRHRAPRARRGRVPLHPPWPSPSGEGTRFRCPLTLRSAYAPTARRCRPGCGRRRRCPPASPAASIFGPPPRQRERRLRARIGVRPGAWPRARCAGRASGGCRRGSKFPAATSEISARMAIIASQKRSSSAFELLSVGSIISVPGDRPGDGGGVVAEILQPLGDVLDHHPGLGLKPRQSMMHSCATMPPGPLDSTGECPRSRAAM